MIDIFSVKKREFSEKEKEARAKWEFSQKEKEARVKTVIPETEAVRPEAVEAVEPARPNSTRARNSEADEMEAVEAVIPLDLMADQADQADQAGKRNNTREREAMEAVIPDKISTPIKNVLDFFDKEKMYTKDQALRLIGLVSNYSTRQVYDVYERLISEGAINIQKENSTPF